MLAVVLATLLAIITIGMASWYYLSYPTNFQIKGRFSSSGIDLSKPFENSAMVASNFLLTKFWPNDSFNVTIDATRGWQATKLGVYNASKRAYPIIYDEILFETNGSISLKIADPADLFIKPENLTLSLSTGKSDTAFFLTSGGQSLVVTNVSSASIPLSQGNVAIDFQVFGGNITVGDDAALYTLNNNNDLILIRLEPQIIVNAEIAVTGKFGVQSNSFSSATFEFWSSPISAYFNFADGFLSHAGVPDVLTGSQDLNLTELKGSITLLNSQTPYEITVQGYAHKIFIGTNEVTAPNIFRDLVQTISPFSSLLTAIVSVVLSASISLYVTQRKERRENSKTHLKEFKDNLFAPLFDNLVNYFVPYVKLRRMDDYVFLRGLVSSSEPPIDIERLRKKTNTRLVLDLPNHFSDFDSKLKKLSETLGEYSESYIRLAKICEPKITEIGFNIEYGRHGMFSDFRIALPGRRKGGVAEWAYLLLIGAKEEDLNDQLNQNEKTDGKEILKKLQKDSSIVTAAKDFQKISSELEELLAETAEDLQMLLKTTTISGTCEFLN
jgi:hypothetical protein